MPAFRSRIELALDSAFRFICFTSCRTTTECNGRWICQEDLHREHCVVDAARNCESTGKNMVSYLLALHFLSFRYFVQILFPSNLCWNNTSFIQIVLIIVLLCHIFILLYMYIMYLYIMDVYEKFALFLVQIPNSSYSCFLSYLIFMISTARQRMSSTCTFLTLPCLIS